jgi:hypothetical protein
MFWSVEELGTGFQFCVDLSLFGKDFNAIESPGFEAVGEIKTENPCENGKDEEARHEKTYGLSVLDSGHQAKDAKSSQGGGKRTITVTESGSC